MAKTRKKEFREWEYWGRPVPGFGDPRARIWIVGLAPAAHGANRTGRMFTGDSSGNWLYRALHRTGFASQEESVSRNDGMRLTDVYISAAARCAPPDNKPLPAEIENCATFLDREWKLLDRVTLFIALGSIGFNATLRLMERNGIRLPKPKPRFAHDAYFSMEDRGVHRSVLASYHPSRQNTQTGKLTEKMWDGIFFRAREILKKPSRS